MRYSILSLALAALSLASCTGLTGPVIMGADAAGIYSTRPDKPPPADLQDQIAQHQSWCYGTMGDTQCFAHPQDVAPERLVNVDPASAYPVDLPAYRQALAPPRPIVAAASDPPVLLQPVADVQIEKATLKDEIEHDTAPPAPVVIEAPAATQAP